MAYHGQSALLVEVAAGGAVLERVLEGGDHAATHPPAPKTIRASVSTTATPIPGPEELLAYGRAFLTVLSKRVTDASLDAVSQVQLVLAELPVELREFQGEVQAAAARELQQGATMLVQQNSSSDGRAAQTSVNSSKGSSTRNGPQDLGAVVDELRADIAASRSLLQQMRSKPVVASSLGK
eukprot:gene3801-4058_t